MLQVVRFPEAVEAAVEELMPNRITDYLYDLSEKFNGFYTDCKVSMPAVCTAADCICGAHLFIMRCMCVCALVFHFLCSMVQTVEDSIIVCGLDCM